MRIRRVSDDVRVSAGRGGLSLGGCGDPSSNTMTAAFVMSAEEFYTAKLTAQRRHNSSEERRRVPRDVSMSAIKYLAVFAALSVHE